MADEISPGCEKIDDLGDPGSKVLIENAPPYIVTGGTWQVAPMHIWWIFRSFAP
jgi:hypothetical protein